MECEVIVIPAGRMARCGSPTPEVACRSPASLLVKSVGQEKKKWMCLPHFSAEKKAGLVESPVQDETGSFVISPGEVACAYNAECKQPIGGTEGAFLVKQAFTGHYVIVCKKHYDHISGSPRMKVIEDPPPKLTVGGSSIGA